MSQHGVLLAVMAGIILSGIHEYYEPEELVGKTAIAIVKPAPAQDDGH